MGEPPYTYLTVGAVPWLRWLGADLSFGGLGSIPG